MQNEESQHNQGASSPSHFSEQQLREYASDPRRIGPGAWFFMEMLAAHSNTREEQLYACRMMRQFCESFKCGNCQGHCRRYVQEHPPELSLDNEGLFEWIVTFRNSVQKRLGAPLYDKEILLQIHTDVNYAVCQKGCGEGGSEKSENVNSNTRPGSARTSASGNNGSKFSTNNERTNFNHQVVEVRTEPQKVPNVGRGIGSSGTSHSHGVNTPVSGGYYSEEAVSLGIDGSDLHIPQYQRGRGTRVQPSRNVPEKQYEHPYIELNVDEARAAKLVSSFSSNDRFTLYPRNRYERKYN